MNYRNKIKLFASLKEGIKRTAAMNKEAISADFWWDYMPPNPIGKKIYSAEVEHHSEVGGSYDLELEGTIASKSNDHLTLENGEKIFLDNDSILAIEDMDDSIYIIYQKENW